jgi:hypothetical protein
MISHTRHLESSGEGKNLWNSLLGECYLTSARYTELSACMWEAAKGLCGNQKAQLYQSIIAEQKQFTYGCVALL